MKLDEKNMQKYKYFLTLLGITVVGTIAVWFLVLSPLIKTTSSAGTELKSKQTEYDSLVAKKNKLDTLKDQEAELKAKAETVSNALPSSEEIGRLFIQLDGLAQSSNGKLKSVTKVSTTTEDASASNLASAGITKNVYSLPLDLPSYFDLKSFIANSQSALRLFSINDFSISASDSGALTVGLTANSYTRN